MQALQYTRTLKEIEQALKVNELLSLLTALLKNHPTNQSLSPGERDRFATLSYGSRAGFERLMDDPQASKVLKSLRIDEIYEPTRLGRMMSTLYGAANVNQVRAYPEIWELHSLLFSLANLINSCSELLEKEKLAPAKAADEILELQVIDYDGSGIEPSRLGKVIAVIIRLHVDLARILDVQEDQLRFVYFDSGSDVGIGIQAAKIILENLRILITEYWINYRFREFETFDKRMGAISRSLSIMGKVQESIEKNVINLETGEILKRRVLKEVDQLIGLGAMIPVAGTENIDHRQLLAAKRDTKLLGSGMPPAEEEDGE